MCDHHCHCKSIHASEHKRTRKQVCDCARDGHAPWAENRYYHLPSPPSSSSARHEATAGSVRVSFVGWFGGVGPRCVCACRFASTTRLCLTRACFCTNRGHALPPGGLPALTQVRNQQTTSLYPIPPHPLTIHTHINPTTGGPGLPAGRVPGPPQLEGLPRRVPERCVALFVVGDCGGGSHVARLVLTSYIYIYISDTIPGSILREQLRPDVLLLNTGLWKALECVRVVCIHAPCLYPKSIATTLPSDVNRSPQNKI